MLGQYLVTFREALEAALITSIVLAYLARAGRERLSRYVWYGVILATLVSVVLGASIWLAYGALSERVQKLFEGTAALIAVFVLSSMIYWMAVKGKELKTELERQVEAIATRCTSLGLVFFAFIIVFREGLETVLFLTPFLVSETTATVSGLFLGMLTALAIAYGIFVVGIGINLQRFFYFTSILLVLLAGGLTGYGVHELIEYTGSASWGWLSENAYNLNIPSNSPFHHKGVLGSILAVMLGYTVKAEWLRLVVHSAYLATAIPLVIRAYRKN